MEMGAVDRLVRQHYPRDFLDAQKCQAKSYQSQEIGYEKTLVLYFLLVIGIALGATLASLEKVWLKRRPILQF